MVRQKAAPSHLPSSFAVRYNANRTSAQRDDQATSTRSDELCISHHDPVHLPSFRCYWQSVKSPVHCFLGFVTAPLTKVFREGSFLDSGRLVCVVCKKCQMVKIAKRYVGNKRKRTIQEEFFEASYNDEESEEFIAMTQRMIFSKNFFAVAFSRRESIIEMHIYLPAGHLNNPSISALSYPSINNVIAHFFPRQVQRIENENIFAPKQKEDCKGFLRLLSYARPTYKDWKLSLSSIVPILRPYQMDAVRFMISREVEPDLDASSKSFFVEIPANPPFYFAIYTGAVFDTLPKPFEVPPGGILADEMGLGKTVELLGLIMSHQRGDAPTTDRDPIVKRNVIAIVLEEIVSTVVAGLEAHLPRSAMTRKRSWDLYYNEIGSEPVKKRAKVAKPVKGVLSIKCRTCGVECSQAKVFWDRFDSSAVPFNCPNCIQKQKSKKPIKATLVVAPSTICHQWYEEVKRHVRDDVKVDIYNGVAAEGYKHPEYLATRDIVICSFETLTNEVHFIETNGKLASLRRRKYLIPPTPLLSVEWWRVCVDEAQVIESRTSVVSEMCWRLQAVNRWCITGTPITDSVDNLFGLLCFIGVEPYCYSNWWEGALWLPYQNGCTQPLVDLFSKILWRNTKEDVIDQIAPPARGSEVTVLHFSPLEEQLYRETLDSRLRRSNAATLVSDFNDVPISEVHGKIFDAIMEPLEGIRKFIVQPGLRFAKTKQRVTSEEGMLEELFRITTHQVEESQRSLAGIDWLTGCKSEAARQYENTLAALRLLDETNEKLGLTEKRGAFRRLRSDKLQVAHAMNSIIDLINVGGEIRGIGLEAAHLKLKEAEEGYTEQAIGSVHSAHDAICEIKSQYGEVKTYMDSAIGWVSETMSTAERASLRHVFVDAIRSVLDNNSRTDFPVHSALAASLICVQRWDEMIACVRKTVELMDQLVDIGILNSPSEGLEAIIACHYKSVETPRRNCDLCLFNKQLNSFESLMFVGAPPKRKYFDGEEETVEGTAGAKKASSLEIVLHAIRSVMLRNSGHFHKRLLDAAKETESLIDLFKTILQKGKDLYGAYEDVAARTDELRQCKMRLEYASEETIEQYGGMSNLPHNYIIRGSEEGTRQAHAEAVRTEQLAQTRLLSKLRYVSTLRHSQRSDCPICLNRIEDAWLVFPCAHCLCTVCFGALSKYNVSVSSVLKCPVCRSMTTRGSIAFVQNRGPSRSLHFLDSPSVTVKGDASVKLDAVIRRLLSIHERDPWAKTLVFTSIPSIIPVICGLFQENSIAYRNYSVGKRQVTLAEFRLDPKIQVLVMPINQGARGLNLTVANNIIFVEPQLDASQLAQAIGRIDRIGQTRRMMIHHFVVYGSIEEHIHHRITDPQNTEWTVGDLKRLLYTGVQYFDQALNNESTQTRGNATSTST